MDAQPYLAPLRPPPSEPEPTSWRKKLLVPLGMLGLLFSKLKGFLFLGLKFLPILLKTGGTMILSLAFYASSWGWRFALGFILLLFVHECGHLIAARRLGLKVGAPVFIPFMGALIALKEAPRNAWVEAQVGIGGPLLGSAGAAACLGIYQWTGNPLYSALAYVGFMLNLFNLAPISPLDGGRIVTALSPWLWLVGLAAIGFLLLTHFNFLLLLILIFAVPRVMSLFRRRTAAEARYFEVTPVQRCTMGVLYFGLAVSLVLAMKVSHIPPP